MTMDEHEVCECELDWRCGLHAGLFTPLELANDWAAQMAAEIDRIGGLR